MNFWLVFAITLTALPAGNALAAQAKPAGQGEVVAVSGQTQGSYRVFAHANEAVPRFQFRIEIDMADGRIWRALPHFQNQHTDYDEPFEKAPVEMTVASGGRLLVFAPFTGMPGEVIEVTYLAAPAAPTFLYLVNPRSSGSVSGECWYGVWGLVQRDTPYTLHLKPRGDVIAGQLLDPSSAVVADLAGMFHGSVLIGTITPRAGRSEPQGRLRWTFVERGRQFEGDWWSGEERRYLTGGKDSQAMKILFVSIVLLSLPGWVQGQKGSVPIAGIRPGVSTRAEVDLAWGGPGARVGDQAFAYAAPASLLGAQGVVVTYFGDTTQVSRIDVYLTNLVPPDNARADATLGVRTLARDRGPSEQEEFYAASMRGLILTSKDASARVGALSYLSARFLADLYAERFHACMREKRYADARVEAEKTIAIDNDYARGYLLEGDFLASVGNDEEGLVRYIAAASAKYPPAYVFRGHLVLITQYGLRKKWPDKAQVEFQQALAGAGDASDRAEAHRLWAEVLLDQKRDADALAELNRAVEAYRSDTRAQLALADYYYGKREYGNARPHYEIVAKALDSGPVGEPVEKRREEIYSRYAYTLNDAHDPDKAEKYYTAVLQLDPRDTMALNNLGNILRATGRVPAALDLYRRGLAVRPDDQRLLNNYAEGLLHEEQYDEARQKAQHELTLKADDGQAKAIVARAWAGQGKKKEALEWLRQSAASGYHNRELASDPAFHKLAKDEVFRKIVEQMK